MKRISLTLSLLLAFSSIAYCVELTPQEENIAKYKARKIEIVLASDYKVSSASTGKDVTFTTGTIKEETSWKIMRGGVSEISKTRFLRVIGETERADRIDNAAQTRSYWLVGGLGIVLLGSMFSKTDPVLGTVCYVVGGVLGIMGFSTNSEKDDLGPREAKEKAELYNLKLRKELGIPDSVQ